MVAFFFFKQKTAYEMRISDWSSDVCSSDLPSSLQLVNRAIGRSPGSSGDRATPRQLAACSSDRGRRIASKVTRYSEPNPKSRLLRQTLCIGDQNAHPGANTRAADNSGRTDKELPRPMTARKSDEKGQIG